MRGRKVVIIILSIITFIILLDFIPVKMAINTKKDELKKMLKGRETKQLYICRYTQVTGSIWLAIGDENGVRDLITGGSIYLAEPLSGKDPLKSLNKSFVPYYTRNKYVFIGEEGNVLNEAGDLMIDFKVDEWRIVSPIRRDSFRDIYAPKSYLTIYDFIKFK
ncbi:hypothetical protein HNQ80_003352 [Anaerosolibacter carboniphilus]|uniref:Uncharacterized protein n=1 Tax=Anaerosolibacter carboniphilus TaxID=1417629 RepID=A0A841KV30_9FIRM|nr:hypothetical protein [Anaerosolibacter carboniphilus]MBB6217233.1 hypothetical protein [Anaerosolibacter carboniphilus]